MCISVSVLAWEIPWTEEPGGLFLTTGPPEKSAFHASCSQLHQRLRVTVWSGGQDSPPHMIASQDRGGSVKGLAE